MTLCMGFVFKKCVQLNQIVWINLSEFVNDWK